MTEHTRPFVRETLGEKSLYLSATEIQSRMQLKRPDALELDYTRTMMGFLMFKPAPQHMAMIGLGGGSIAKWCHRHLPRSTLLAVEINPHVIALRDAFQVPPDDARLQVICMDGEQFVADTAERFDVLLLDAFDAQGTPPALCTQRFFDDCMDALNPGGLLVINMHATHPEFNVYTERIRRACEGHLLQVDHADGSNVVVFASKGVALPRLPALKRPRGLSVDAWVELAPALSRIGHALALG
jgi:spermidine synthase